MKRNLVAFALAASMLTGCAGNEKTDMDKINGGGVPADVYEEHADTAWQSEEGLDKEEEKAAGITAGAGAEKEDNEDMADDRVYLVYEASMARLTGGVKAVGKAGTGYIEGFEQDDDKMELDIEVPYTGFYDINVISRSIGGGHKENYLLIDNENAGTLKVEGSEFTDSRVNRIYLEKGVHTVTVKKFWGWIQIERICVEASQPLDEDRFNVEPVLVNPNASDNAKRLMKYMCDIYGTDILSGQYCENGMYGKENQAIYKATGKYPAILGLDMIEYSPSRAARGSSSMAVEHAIEYWDNGGIVTFCWHWNAPEKYLTGTWYSGFYKEHTNIDLAAVMNGSDDEGYRLLNEDIDAVAQQLMRLQEAGVPVLWRPLHEAAGGWFWWGAAGADAYKKLYVLLYDRLTNEYGLNNLIWVWNGQDKDWYPGDEYVDIIGEDIYPGERVYTPQTSKYLEVLEYTDMNKMIVLSENGCLFDPDLAERDGAMWGCFITWNGEFVLDGSESEVLSEKYTQTDMLKKVYGHEHVITRDELPDLKNYHFDDKSKQ